MGSAGRILALAVVSTRSSGVVLAQSSITSIRGPFLIAIALPSAADFSADASLQATAMMSRGTAI